MKNHEKSQRNQPSEIKSGIEDSTVETESGIKNVTVIPTVFKSDSDIRFAPDPFTQNLDKTNRELKKAKNEIDLLKKDVKTEKLDLVKILGIKLILVK